MERFIATFVEVWPTKDASCLVDLFTDDAIYHNVPLEAVRGKEAIGSTLEAFMGLGGDVQVDLRNVVTSGHLVVVERVDHFTRSGQASSVPILGIFEIRGELIEAWRDYFDLSQFRS